MQELYHKTGKPLKRSRDPDSGAYFDQNSFDGVDVNL